MTLESLIPLLRTWDLPGSLNFYVDTLGFTCGHFSEEWGWATLRRGGIELMLAGPNSHDTIGQSTFTGSLYFRTTDVDALWIAMKDKVRVCYPIEDFSYGMREFAIFDNNGYVLQFGQPLRIEPLHDA